MWMLGMNLLVFITVLGAALFLAQPYFTQYVESYAVRTRPRKAKAELTAIQPQNSDILFLCKIVGEFALRVLPGIVDKRTQELLAFANYRSEAHLAIYIGIRLLVASACLLLSLIAALGSSTGLLLSAPATLMAWLLPNFFLAGRARKRQHQILRELPVLIDLLIVCAQAGVGLLAAMDKVSRETSDTCPVLSAELQQLIQEVKVFAKSAGSALANMADRCGVDELTSLAGALVAAEQKGADISFPLKQQAAAIRDRLKRKKEEEAAKVPVKMVPVIMLFVMPLILAPMLGPAIVTIVDAMQPIIGVDPDAAREHAHRR
jgi:pilus assembly protein TadC